jgi:hypothetical protein
VFEGSGTRSGACVRSASSSSGPISTSLTPPAHHDAASFVDGRRRINAHALRRRTIEGRARLGYLMVQEIDMAELILAGVVGC